MDFEQVLTLRQTTRKYTDQKVSDSDLEKILQAAQTAPLAAGDDKTTHLTLVKDPVLMEEIRNACMLTSRNRCFIWSSGNDFCLCYRHFGRSY